MPEPPADVPEPDETAVRLLLADVQDEALAGLPLTFVARGWDNAVWRVGDRLTARIPLRVEAVDLLRNEAEWGRHVVEPWVAAGVAVSQPVRLVPPGAHPYPWLLAGWVDGAMLEDVPVSDRGQVAVALAGTLPAVHRPAPPEAPLNPYRGVDIADLPPIRPDALEVARSRLGPTAEDLLTVFAAGRAAPRWPHPRVWCHGDLHPRNLLLRPAPADAPATARLGVLDLGDLTGGDPAVDLAVLWLSFDADQREACLARLAPAYDDAVVTRARGWAARFVVAVSGVCPDPFERTLAHATAQVLG